MKREIISTGTTIDDAIDSACVKNGLDRDSIEIEVIDTPSKGFMGLGQNKAKIKILIDEKMDVENTAIDFLTGMFSKMGVESPKIKTSKEDKDLRISIEGSDMGAIIGRRGETMDAIQYITSLIVNKECDEFCRVLLDIEGYREKRQQALEDLALRLATRVVKSRRSVTLEPMQPYERRIIHFALQNFEGVSTFSTGEDPHRKIVISFGGDKKGENNPVNNA